jgi:hypothetical protein
LARFVALALLVYLNGASVGSAETPFVAPPRTISDITALLDQQKPSYLHRQRRRALNAARRRARWTRETGSEECE